MGRGSVGSARFVGDPAKTAAGGFDFRSRQGEGRFFFPVLPSQHLHTVVSTCQHDVGVLCTGAREGQTVGDMHIMQTVGMAVIE